MINIAKTYSIKYSYAGINQYADFYEKEDGELHRPVFHPSYARDGVPSVEGLKTIQEVLTVIKAFSYCEMASIYSIDGELVSYRENKKAKKEVKGFSDRFEAFMEQEALNFFTKIIEPILVENKMFIAQSHIGYFVLIAKDEEGEWDLVKDKKKEFEIEYLLYKFLSNFKKIDTNFKDEIDDTIDFLVVQNFLDYIPDEVIKEKGLFIDVN